LILFHSIDGGFISIPEEREAKIGGRCMAVCSQTIAAQPHLMNPQKSKLPVWLATAFSQGRIILFCFENMICFANGCH
jgi:hypothetical protein